MNQEDYQEDSEVEETPAPVFYVDAYQLQYLMNIRAQIAESRAVQVLNWHAENLAVVAAADGESRGRLAIIDILLDSAKLVDQLPQ